MVKVKEPLAVEYAFLREQFVSTYFHLAGVTPTLTETLLECRPAAIAYQEDKARGSLLQGG